MKAKRKLTVKVICAVVLSLVGWAILSVIWVTVVLLVYLNHAKQPDKDPDTRPVEVRMEEIYGMPFEVLGRNKLNEYCTVWNLRSSEEIECYVVLCDDYDGGASVLRYYDTYCVERCAQSDAMQALLAMDGVEIIYRSTLTHGAFNDELPMCWWVVNIQSHDDDEAVYALIDEAMTAADMSADDIYRTDYWRSLPPSFDVYEEFGRNTVITLTDDAD